MAKIKAGDVVLLKSGGPEMTVEAVMPNGAHCVWFDGSKVERGVFNPPALLLVGSSSSEAE